MNNLPEKIGLKQAQPNETFEQRYSRILSNYQTLLNAYQEGKKAGADHMKLWPEVEKIYSDDLVGITEMALSQSSLKPESGDFDPMALNMLMQSMIFFARKLNVCGIKILYPKREAPDLSKGCINRIIDSGKNLIYKISGKQVVKHIGGIDELAKYHWEKADLRFYNNLDDGVEVEIPDFEVKGIGYSHNVEILTLNEEGKKKFGYDTILRVGCAFDFLEGYMNNYSIKFKDGKFVSGIYGSEYAALFGEDGVFARFSNLQKFLQNIAENVQIPTNRFLTYFAHPSLNNQMRLRIKELLDVKERFSPKTAPKVNEPDISQLLSHLSSQLPSHKEK